MVNLSTLQSMRFIMFWCLTHDWGCSGPTPYESLPSVTIRLRNHLKVIIDGDISEDMKKTDKFWKVRLFFFWIAFSKGACFRPEQNVSVDEQVIPFTGAHPPWQYLPLNPNPVGMNFVLTSANGIVLDFDVYQGANASSSQVEVEGLGLAGMALERVDGTTCLWYKTVLWLILHNHKRCGLNAWEAGVPNWRSKNWVTKAMAKLPSNQKHETARRRHLSIS